MREILRTILTAAAIIASYLFFSILATPQSTDRVIDALWWAA
jgi:hypothetical protein